MTAVRKVLLVIHPTKPEALDFARQLAHSLIAEGFLVFANHPRGINSVLPLEEIDSVASLEIAVVLGGDGTILRAAELVRGFPIPILGVNLGKVGFLAEVSQPQISEIVRAICESTLHPEPRLTLKYQVLRGGKVIATGWALNEVTIERNHAQMVELFLQIDNRPLSRWGCDGVICSTPTGSTAYAFSAGGPVVWPEVNALVLLPLAAHALFSRPMVVSPDSQIAVDVESREALLAADGMRKVELLANDQILLNRDSELVLLSHIDNSVFTDRLVAKFKLPIEGWRGGK
ncbi:MAG: NAD kinase [Actinomycetes bacterium]